jgi:hypothetical protein
MLISMVVADDGRRVIFNTDQIVRIEQSVDRCTVVMTDGAAVVVDAACFERFLKFCDNTGAREPRKPKS